MIDVYSPPLRRLPYLADFDFVSVLLLVLFAPLAIFIVKLALSKGSFEEKLEVVKKSYLFAGSFISLIVFYLVLADLINIVINLLSGNFSTVLTSVLSGGLSGYGTPSFETVAKGLSYRVSIALVFMPLFAYHFIEALTPLKTQTQDLTTLFKILRNLYLWMIILLFSIILLGFGIGLINKALQYALGVKGITLSEIAAPLSFTVPAVLFHILHIITLKKKENHLDRTLLKAS
ncbi:MAG: DUF5671 domain-containing protein [Patescibacteria group bacterium]